MPSPARWSVSAGSCGDALPGRLDRAHHRPHRVGARPTFVLYALAGGVAGYVTVKLREAERRISAAQAREEVARTLHDGVLQTLAVVQRRATDPDLARLARDQERELREFLFGLEPAAAASSDRAPGGGGALRGPLRRPGAGGRGRRPARAAGRRWSRRWPVPSARRSPTPASTARAGHVTVYAEPADDGGVFCSVKDDGHGLRRPTPEGVGSRRSIRGRMAEVGGRVEIDGNPGRGTEVRLWA